MTHRDITLTSSSLLHQDILIDSYYPKAGGSKMRLQSMQRYVKDGRRVTLIKPRFNIFSAGVVGKITKFLAQVVDPRPPTKVNLHDKTKKHKVHGIVMKDANGEEYRPRAEYLYYEVEVESLAKDYPESDERIRKWVYFPRPLSELAYSWDR
jgi:hypothetical protein